MLRTAWSVRDLAQPSGAFQPTDKPRVERSMRYVQGSLWRGREFTSLGQMQAEAERWCTEAAGTRACRPVDGAEPAAVFGPAEKGALRPLPSAGHVDQGEDRPGHPRPGRHDLHSVPWLHIGKTSDVRVTGRLTTRTSSFGTSSPRHELAGLADLSPGVAGAPAGALQVEQHLPCPVAVLDRIRGL